MIGIRKHHIYKKFEREGELNMNKYIELYRKFKELQKAKLTKPVVIPSAINMQNVKKAYTTAKQDKL